MNERRCPNCDSRLASDQKVCGCCSFTYETKPKKKPAAKKVVKKEPPRKRGPKGRFLKD